MTGTSLAQTKAEQRGRPFGDLFRQQFVLAKGQTLGFDGFEATTLGGFVLHHGSAVRVTEIWDSHGLRVGLLLGVAVTPEGVIPEAALDVPAKAGSPRFWTVAERVIAGLIGRYLAVVVVEGAARVYFDPVCDMSAVYDPDTGLLGSSVPLVLRRPVQMNPTFDLHRILTHRGNFSFQETVDARVIRAIPNHYLDLQTGAFERHWPKTDMLFEAGPDDVDEIIDRSIARLGQTFGALVKGFDCMVPVTGGRDSRLLVACGREHLEHVRQFGAFRFHNPSRVDAIAGRDVVEHLGHRFEQYFLQAMEPQALRDFWLKSGYSGVRGEIQALMASLRVPKDHLILRGNIMELLRANQWRERLLHKPFRIVHGLKRLKIQSPLEGDAFRQVWAPRYMQWLESLPDTARSKAYDFGFVEHLLPNTQGGFFGGFHDAFYLNPFNDRQLIADAIRLPNDMRFDGRIVHRMLERSAPDLLELPFV